MNIIKKIQTRLSTGWSWFWQRSLWLKLLALVLITGLGWYGYSKYTVASQQQTTYTTEKAEKGTLVVSVSASGNAITGNFAEITTQASGVVSNLYVKDGDIVTQGEKIADITLDQQGQKQQTEAYASYLSAKNNLDAANVALYTLQSDMFAKWDTFRTLATNSTYQESEGVPNYVNRALPEFHIANDNWLAAEAKYKNQQSVISQAQASVSNAWTTYQLTSGTITAPTGGTINNITIVPGIQLAALTSSSTTTSDSTNKAQRVAVIQNEGNPFISLNLTEIDIPTVQADQKATVTFDSIKDKTFTGRVRTIDRIGSASNGVTTYPITVQLDTEVREVLPNMSATANIITKTKDNVLLVSNAAVTTADGVSTVQVMKNGTPETVAVTVGDSSDTQTEIVSGISEGDIIVIGTTAATTTTSTTTRSAFSTGGGFGGLGGGNRTVIRTR